MARQLQSYTPRSLPPSSAHAAHLAFLLRSLLPMTVFGPYRLLELVGTGGMAEVFLAKRFGARGFEKLVALKRILPRMAEDKTFVSMFADEARISGQLTHSCIAAVLDFGVAEGCHYLAMEYVRGKDLLVVLERFALLGQRMPPTMAVHIAAQMCAALDYAHHKRGPCGSPLSIIHRDVSPHNVLIGYEGQVKLIDFGLAKAASRCARTEAGIVKGKLAYMSPEQVRGLPIDHRSDVFAVGTCLHEMVTGRRLFLGHNDFSTMRRLREHLVPRPTELAPGIPRELEGVIMKALARDPEDRYQTAGEMREALLEVMGTTGSQVSVSVGAWMRFAFQEELAATINRLKSYSEVGQGTDPMPPPRGLFSTDSARAREEIPFASTSQLADVELIEELELSECVEWLEDESTEQVGSPHMEDLPQMEDRSAPAAEDELDGEPTHITSKVSLDTIEESCLVDLDQTRVFQPDRQEGYPALKDPKSVAAL